MDPCVASVGLITLLVLVAGVLMCGYGMGIISEHLRHEGRR